MENRHYSEQTGHQMRGDFNKAMLKLERKGVELPAKGDIYIKRRFMKRVPKDGR